MAKYKMRAECMRDVGEFLMAVPTSRAVLTRELPGYPDVDIEFESPATLGELRQALGEIVDGHVMAETVNLAAEYTGERGE